MQIHRNHIIFILFLLAVVAAQTVALDVNPALWRDEGWTLTVARDWVARGHYGMFLNGQPASPGLSAAFPSVASIAICFHLFGVGVWQARIVSALYMLGAFGLLAILARRLYNPRVGWAVIPVVVLLSAHIEMNPLAVGREVLAEPLMLFYLLAGYALFYLALARSTWFLLATCLAWGIGIISKGQPLPFWTSSLVVPLIFMSVRRKWKIVVMLVVALVGTFLTSRALLGGIDLLLRGHTVPLVPLNELFAVTAIVLDESARTFALQIALIFGFALMLGLAYATIQWLCEWRAPNQNDAVTTVRLALLSFTGSWFAWYVLLSVGWVRYLFPAMFVGSVFVAAFLHDLTAGFDLRATIQKASLLIRTPNRARFGAFAALVLIVLYVPLALFSLSRLLFTDITAHDTATWLNSNTPSTALIETYDDELFFFLNRPYHYPPDELNVVDIQRLTAESTAPLEYDAFSANPDYIVVGRHSRETNLYDAALATGEFARVAQFGRYEVFARLR